MSDYEDDAASNNSDDEWLEKENPKKKLKTMKTAVQKTVIPSLHCRMLVKRPLMPSSAYNRSNATGGPSSLFKPFKVPSLSANAPAHRAFKAGSQLGTRRMPLMTRGPLHDPEVEGAVILFSPKELSEVEKLELAKSSALASNASAPQQQVHVVVDPVLSKILRPHQVEGVRFLYDCVTGRKVEGSMGCVMADEMGLGKTLQCITLLWTLLKQSPCAGKPTIEKAIITCPSSVVKNWANELKKWLGADKIAPLSCDNKGTKEQTIKDLEQFACSKGRSIVNPGMTLRAYGDTLAKTEIGLMLCDEGHRLKNKDSLTYQSLNRLNVPRRVILSGTPIQNDLTEYFSLLSFVCPGVLGSESDFRKKYENPILRGRDAEASELDRKKSEDTLMELQTLANRFIIRRTADLLTKFLPVKHEHVVFCKLSDVQLSLYRHFNNSPELKKLLSGATSQPLKAITMLKKLCNHPELVADSPAFSENMIPANPDKRAGCYVELSGKMLLLRNMLQKIKNNREKIVLISNYTQTLDLFEGLCRGNRWGVLRLDGSMTIPKRQKLVDRFNDLSNDEFVFLLSSKAGGCGLNLIGANRLVLFDPDWNPANDAQALARVWRDGQKKTCFIYRFIATGTLEEKIFQRQAQKQALSSCVVDEEENVERHFTTEALRRQQTRPGKLNAGATAADTSNWNHFSLEELHKIPDVMLREAAKETGMLFATDDIGSEDFDRIDVTFDKLIGHVKKLRKDFDGADFNGFVQKVELLNRIFDIVISRFTSHRRLLSEIQREYEYVINAIKNQIEEKEFLRVKIQKLIGELGTRDILLQETHRVSHMLYKIEELCNVNTQAGLYARFDLRINYQPNSDYFSAEDNQRMSLKFKGKKKYVQEWLMNRMEEKECAEELTRLMESNPTFEQDDTSPASRQNGGDITKRKAELETLQKNMRAFQQELTAMNDKIEAYTEEVDQLNQPDGSQIVAAAGAEVLVYDVAEGELLQALKAHKDTVYAVDYSADGTRFATGGADKQVIIWNSKMEGILKYSHSDSIQAIAHNPVTGQVVSCTSTDFGLWSSEQKTVTKHKVPSRILTVSWTNDGQFFALGLFNGNISIRNRSGEEKVRIERGSSPIWSLQWCPAADKESDLLAVTDWNQRLSFFQLSGRQVGKDRILGYDPNCVSFFSSGEFIVVGGSDRKVTLWTSEGIRLGLICERESWVWCCKVKPKQNYVAVGCQDGTIALYQIVFNTVHGLYNDRYAYRENMTDVVIQHLSTDQRARIKCRDYVKKIAVFKDRLAVQLPDRVIIYELFHDDATDMHYRIKEKLQKKLDCNLLVVTSQHIILCLEKKLQMFHFNGEKEREWNLEALIRYIKVTGGPRGREGLLVGLKNGQIFQIFIDNPFPIPLIKQQTSVRCLDLSMSRTKLAVVDEHNMCLVYDLRTKELLFQEPNANSVAWNTELEDMLCYSGNGILNIKAGNFPAHQQKMQGFVVGFKGSRIFCLHIYTMTTVDVPQSASLDRYLEKKEFEQSYKVACLGVTEGDWRRLAVEALEGLHLEVATKSFVRVKDLRFLDLIRNIEKMKSEGKNEVDLFVGEIHAHAGRFHEAAKLFKRAGYQQKAIEMYTELNMWEYATQMAADTNMDTSEILKRKAQIQQDRNDLMAAASTYIEVGDYLQAINILGPNGSLDKLIEITRKLKKSDSKALSRCLYFFRKHNNHTYAAECLVKMGDISHLLSLHIELQQWDEAFRIAETHPEFASQIYLPYANWLAINDRYMEAQLNYRKAGRIDEAMRVLRNLASNAVVECRFDDAAYYFWLLSTENLELIPSDLGLKSLTEAQRDLLRSFYKCQELAELYFAYHSVKHYVDEPFTSHLPDSLLNMARFVTQYLLSHRPPPGISKAYTIYALTKIAKSVGAYKLARFGYEQLQTMRIPPEWEEMAEVGALTIRGKMNVDKDELLPYCFSCASINPLLNAKGDMCINCSEPFVRSFYSFEMLPMVEFVIEDGLSEEEADALLAKDPPVSSSGVRNERGSDNRSGKRGRDKSQADNDLNQELEGLERMGADADARLVLGRHALLSLRRSEVFIQDWGKKCIPRRYFKVAQKNVSIVMCPSCQRFFMDDEWNYHYLQKESCNFCRQRDNNSNK
ncbi:hypothetical protein HDU76_000838 [Blyttiomyces sp. JEL0837]|nr:hypothetical protein HDU76_000838 [Blyttiomyces sp. JEL0837]